MKKELLHLLVAMLMLASHAQAQSTRCHTMENLERLKLVDPLLESRMLKIENQSQQIIAKSLGQGNMGITSVINIPVVVHVVYNTSSQNISDVQVQSQITILNNDYRRLNADKVNTPSTFSSVATDAEITFCLAGTSPSGATTTGITRTHTNSSSFSDDDAVKYSSQGGEDAWPSDQYLNIWVCNLGGGLLGYAQFPGGPSATDGVVILYSGFGSVGNVAAPYNKGRSATHEVGHWLNLRHIWGDSNCGNDLVSDTPTQTEANYSCPSHPKSNSCGTSAEMFMNYMDYSDDACMNMFSAGQKSRMKALFAPGGYREALASSGACGGGSTPPPATCNVPAGLNATAVSPVSATLNWTTVSGALSYSVNVKASTSTSWSSFTATTNSLSINGLSASKTYQFQVKTSCASGTSAFSSIQSFTTPGSTPTSSTTVTVGTGTSVTGVAPYGTGYMDEKTQFIITKSELVAGGYSTANNILKSLAFNVYSASSKVLEAFTIRVRHTTANSYANTSYYSATNMTTVYSGNYTAVSGWNTHNFTTPFTYNGTDNLLVEICWNNSTGAVDSKVYCSTTPTVKTVYKKSNLASAGICDVTTGGLSTSRPNVKLGFFGFSSAPASKLANDEDGQAEEGQDNSDFNLYPNPATSKINITYTVLNENNTVEVLIYNMMGAVIGKYDQGMQSGGSHLFSLDFTSDFNGSELSSGIYLCSLRVGDMLQTKRFVVKR